MNLAQSHRDKIGGALNFLKRSNEITSFEIVDDPHDDFLITCTIVFTYKHKKLDVTVLIDLLSYETRRLGNIFFCNLIERRKKGEEAELRMFAILRRLIQNRKFGICSVFRASEYLDNKMKADLVFFVDCSIPLFEPSTKVERLMIYLQIKSSVEKQDIHKVRYPNIPSIVINHEITDSTIIQAVKEIIETTYIISKVEPAKELVTLSLKDTGNYGKSTDLRYLKSVLQSMYQKIHK